jgi:PAS domain S-box-containing protein
MKKNNFKKDGKKEVLLKANNISELEKALQKEKNNSDRAKALNQRLNANIEQLMAANQQIRGSKHQLYIEALERRQAEEKLRYSETMLNDAQHLAKIGSWELDLAINKLYWSDEIYKIFNLKPSQFGATYDAFLNAIHPDDRDMVNKAYTESVKNKTPYDIVHRLLSKNEKIKFVHERCKTFYDKVGKPIRSMGTIQDITERRKAEEILNVQNQQLRAIEQQLRASNQQLTATEQQLKAQNQQLKASEQQLIVSAKEIKKEKDFTERIVSTAQAIIMVLDKNGKIVTYNPYMEKLSGYKLKEMKGKDWFTNFLPKCDYNKIRKVFKESIKDVQMVSNINPILIKKGEERLIEWHTKTLKDKNDNIIGVISIGQDVTDRLKAKKNLKESEGKLRNILANATNAIYVHTSDHVLTYMSPQFKKILGYTPQEAMVRWTEFASDNPINEEGFKKTEKAIKTGKAQGVYELELIHKNGKKIFVEIRENPVVENGKTVSIVGSLLNISVRKKAEEKLKESEKFLKNTGYTAKVGGWELDIKTQETRWTEEVYNIYGVPMNKKPPLENAIDFYHPEDRPKIKSAVENALKHGKPYDLEVRFINAKGENLWVRTIGKPMIEKGKVLKIGGTFQDITDRKLVEMEKEQLNNQLIQSQKMESMGVLAGGVAHDFNNILTAIIGDTDLLLGEKDIKNKFSVELESIRNSADRAADLVKQLLIFCRKDFVRMKDININMSIKDSMKMIKRVIGEQINIKLNLSKTNCSVWGDSGNINQIMVNMAVNAKDAMPDGGNLNISTKKCALNEEDVVHLDNIKPGEYIKVSIEDSGAGINKEIQGKIFEPFFTSKGIGRGTGLGLSVVFGIIKAHNGGINVYSEQSRGTIFNIYLPISKCKIKVKTVKKNIVQKGHGEQILIVEDENFIHQMLLRMLKKTNYRILFAVNMAEAVKIYKKNAEKIDLVLCDMVLPDGNGLDVIKKLNKIKPVKKVIYTSGYLDIQTRWAEIEENNIPFIHKPFHMVELLKIIGDTLK